MYGFDHGVWMFGGWLVMLAIWVLPFVALFAAIKYLLGRSDSSGQRPAISSGYGTWMH